MHYIKFLYYIKDSGKGILVKSSVKSSITTLKINHFFNIIKPLNKKSNIQDDKI